MESMERLQKFLAQAGVASRRKAEELILLGKVKVNGKTVTRLGTKVNPALDIIEVDGNRLQKRSKYYILLYKPLHYISSCRDPQHRRTVLDLVPDINERLYPVGRLDYDTEGLIILTNDGNFTYRLTHPKHEIGKTYRALVKGIPSEQELTTIANGVLLEDGMTAPAKVKYLGSRNGNALLEITIHEGRNRQVRRMCKRIGHPVLKLKRTAIGFLTIGNLRPGEFRYLTRNEVNNLLKLVT